MTNTIIVRAPTEADFDQWLPLWEGYNEFYGRSGPTELPVEITNMLWSRIFDAYEPVHGLVAELDGKIVGLVHYLFHRVTNNIEATCYLEDLYTDENVRGQGVGRALIEAVYEKAKLANAPQVYWLTHETNATARKLYDGIAENSGFVVYRQKF
ncbi:MAG: GNAT family N-acetyltransferase [Hyphomicrobiales bacterium]|nr:MAG: GNAT family N-acetyltransferase [Hyphomicrobiales bacterium]